MKTKVTTWNLTKFGNVTAYLNKDTGMFSAEVMAQRYEAPTLQGLRDILAAVNRDYASSFWEAFIAVRGVTASDPFDRHTGVILQAGVRTCYGVAKIDFYRADRMKRPDGSYLFRAHELDDKDPNRATGSLYEDRGDVFMPYSTLAWERLCAFRTKLEELDLAMKEFIKKPENLLTAHKSPLLLQAPKKRKNKA